MTRKFHWSAYWKTWSRVLSETHPGGPFVEVDLTPSADSRNEWARIGRIWIRVHGTPRNPEDQDREQLPYAWWREILHETPHGVEQRLMEEDLYSKIDWRLYSRYAVSGESGGVAFDLIKKGRIGT